MSLTAWKQPLRIKKSSKIKLVDKAIEDLQNLGLEATASFASSNIHHYTEPELH